MSLSEALAQPAVNIYALYVSALNFIKHYWALRDRGVKIQWWWVTISSAGKLSFTTATINQGNGESLYQSFLLPPLQVFSLFFLFPNSAPSSLEVWTKWFLPCFWSLWQAPALLASTHSSCPSSRSFGLPFSLSSCWLSSSTHPGSLLVLPNWWSSYSWNTSSSKRNAASMSINWWSKK